MVEISPPSSSYNTRNAPRQRPKDASAKKPIWLLACYALFALACLNFVRTYQEQKELVRSRIEKQKQIESERVEIHYSGAEEHVVTAGVGSSQYGGSMTAAQPGNKKKKKEHFGATAFDGIRPKPSDGSNDYITKHSLSDFKGFSFYVMADTPYTELEEKRLKSQMTELKNYTENNPERNIAFGIHLGGTQKLSRCTESAYENHADTIAKGPSPTFITPGSSDWFDCTQRDEAFGFFLQHLGPDLISRWDANQMENLDFKRSRQNPELFSLCVEGILLIGLHVINPTFDRESTSSRDKRMETSMQWLAESIEGNFAKREIRGVIMLGHARRTERNENFFAHSRKYFDGSSTRKNVPVLYFHGDGLAWKVDKNLSPFYDIQVDRGGLAEPSIIDVAPQRNGKVQSLHSNKNGMQTILGKGLIRLDQQQGRYPDPGGFS